MSKQSELSGKGITRSRPGAVWTYRVSIGGKRVKVSTETTDREEAERIAAQAILNEKQKVQTNTRLGIEPMRFFDACQHWLDDKAGELVEEGLETQVGWLKKKMGNKFCHLIAAPDITNIRKARIATVKRGKGGVMVPVSNSTVNGTLSLLSRILNYAASNYGVEVRRFKWGDFQLAVRRKKAGSRAISEETEETVFANLRQDYWPIAAFAISSGLRASECLIRWDQVDWKARMLRNVKHGKASKKKEGVRDVPLTEYEYKLLRAEWDKAGRHPVFVFTYEARRTRKAAGRKKQPYVKGHRYPILYSNWKEAWDDMKAATGLKVRIHDLRHTAAMRALENKGLYAAKEVLGHASVQTTSDFYASAPIEAVREAKGEPARNWLAPKLAPKVQKIKKAL